MFEEKAIIAPAVTPCGTPVHQGRDREQTTRLSILVDISCRHLLPPAQFTAGEMDRILRMRMVVRVRVGHLPRSHDMQFEYRRTVFGHDIVRGPHGNREKVARAPFHQLRFVEGVAQAKKRFAFEDAGVLGHPMKMGRYSIVGGYFMRKMQRPGKFGFPNKIARSRPFGIAVRPVAPFSPCKGSHLSSDACKNVFS
jgi:hypothetical protein